MEPTSFPYNGQKKNNTKIYVVVGLVILAGAILAFFFLPKQKSNTVEKKEKQTEITKEPTPTEKPKIDKKLVKIQVLNGTGTPGQAGEVAEALITAGYISENIKTGNASESDNLTASISARLNYEEVTNEIKDLLKPILKDAKVSVSEIDVDSDFDIVIVTGGKVYVEATPTASQSATATPTSTVTSTPAVTSTVTPSPTVTLTPTP